MDKLDENALEAARVAAIASWHSEDMSFETALAKAIEAYLDAAKATLPSPPDLDRKD